MNFCNAFLQRTNTAQCHKPRRPCRRGMALIMVLLAVAIAMAVAYAALRRQTRTTSIARNATLRETARAAAATGLSVGLSYMHTPDWFDDDRPEYGVGSSFTEAYPSETARAEYTVTYTAGDPYLKSDDPEYSKPRFPVTITVDAKAWTDEVASAATHRAQAVVELVPTGPAEDPTREDNEVSEFLDDFDWGSFTSYQLYPGGPKYDIEVVTGPLVGDIKPDMETNPAGILFYGGENGTMVLGDDVTVTGTLICDSEVEIQGNGIKVQAQKLPTVFGESTDVKLPAVVARDLVVQGGADCEISGVIALKGGCTIYKDATLTVEGVIPEELSPEAGGGNLVVEADTEATMHWFDSNNSPSTIYEPLQEDSMYYYYEVFPGDYNGAWRREELRWQVIRWEEEIEE